jgi:hypothetical protein
MIWEESNMSNLVNVVISDEYLSVSFDVAEPRIMAVKMVPGIRSFFLMN